MIKVEAFVSKAEKINAKNQRRVRFVAGTTGLGRFGFCHVATRGGVNHGNSTTRLNHIESLAVTFGCGEVGGGGVKSLQYCGPATASGLTQRFFIGLGALNFLKAIKEIKKVNHFNGRSSSSRLNARIIFRGPGGGQKFGRLRARTGGLAAHTFSVNCGIVFCTVGRSQKFAAKFRVGGVSR